MIDSRLAYATNTSGTLKVSIKRNLLMTQFPLNIVFSTDDPEEQLELFDKLFCESFERHAPLRRTRITRLPAPWTDDSIIQEQRDSRRKLRGSSDWPWFARFLGKITRKEE